MAEKTIISNVSEGFEVKENVSDFPKDLFTTVSELTTDGLAITEKGHFLLVNDQLLSTFKLKREELIGSDSLELIHKDDVARAMDEVTRNRKVFYELRVRRGDGLYILTEVRGHPVLFQGRECRLLIVKDITQRKIADRLFNNYLNIIDAFPEAICVHDKSGKILFANRSGVKLVNATSQDEVIGRNVMEFVLPEHQATIRENKPRFEKHEAITGRFVKMKQFGSSEPISVEASVIPTEWGEEPAAMVLCHDTSLEEQIEKSEIAKQVMQS
ncbi:MAG TPA: PAS domain S-box protein, partial [Bacteroidia bacterium]|nr:PAS domain S-box protein [Bacteroidia bacterium]